MVLPLICLLLPGAPFVNEMYDSRALYPGPINTLEMRTEVSFSVWVDYLRWSWNAIKVRNRLKQTLKPVYINIAFVGSISDMCLEFPHQ